MSEAEVLADPDIQKKMGPSLMKKQTSVFDKYSEATPTPQPMKLQFSNNTQISIPSRKPSGEMEQYLLMDLHCIDETPERPNEKSQV